MGFLFCRFVQRLSSIEINPMGEMVKEKRRVQDAASISV